MDSIVKKSKHYYYYYYYLLFLSVLYIQSINIEKKKMLYYLEYSEKTPQSSPHQEEDKDFFVSWEKGKH